MSSTWFQHINIPSEDANKILDLVSTNSYRIITPDLFPVLSRTLLDKCESVLLMRSGSANDEYVVANLYRRDNGMIDQMPFGSSFVSGSASVGLLTHHGDWKGRTAPNSFILSSESSSAYQQSYAKLEMPQALSGSINDLVSEADIKAFERVIAELKSNK